MIHVERWVVPKFEILTDAIWARELKWARGVKNDITTQIMKLHPENPTPGFEPKKDMIQFIPDKPNRFKSCREKFPAAIFGTIIHHKNFHAYIFACM